MLFYESSSKTSSYFTRMNLYYDRIHKILLWMVVTNKFRFSIKRRVFPDDANFTAPPQIFFLIFQYIYTKRLREIIYCYYYKLYWVIKHS